MQPALSSYNRRMWVLSLAAILIAITLIAISPPARAQDPPPTDPPPSARLTGFRFEFQTWNNCGPVNLTMALTYYGWPYDQTVAAAWLKPTVEDKNVSPADMVAYVDHQDDLPHLAALWRYGGTLDVIKRLIAAGFPVVIESGFQPEGLEWMGHYQTIVAYDDAVQTVWIYDSYEGLGPSPYVGMPHTYADFDMWWRHFNRVFIVIYPHDREAEVFALLGPHANPQSAAALALVAAEAEIAADATDIWAWFNAGTSAAALEQYGEATVYFDEAFRLGLPFRMLWYQFGPYEAYYHVGRYRDVITLADDTAESTEEVEETNMWRGLAYAALGRTADALEQFEIALRFNPNNAIVQTAHALVTSGSYVRPAPAQFDDWLP